MISSMLDQKKKLCIQRVRPGRLQFFKGAVKDYPRRGKAGQDAKEQGPAAEVR
jgi:hypothetical protein